ncbi:zinc finger protein PLAG1 [Fusarium bulbicola]|nr:zinc finger protein PLAG1 [Fusarium bulbicola]
MTALTETSFAMFPHHSDAEDFARYTDSNVIFTSGPMDVSIPADAFGFQQQSGNQDAFASSMGFVEPSLYAEAPNYMLNSRASPSMYTDESSDMRLPSSSLSTASAASTTSSAIGSPQSNHGQMGAMPEWAPHGLGLQPAIVGSDYIGSDFASFPSSGMEELSFDFPAAKAFVELTRPPMGIPPYDNHFQQTNANPHHTYPTSPSASSSSPQPHMMRTNSLSPFLQTTNFQSTFPSSPYGAPMDNHSQTQNHNHNHNHNHIRAPSVTQFVPPTPGEYSSDESKEKQRCTYPDCGKTFKDLKAHMLTHQTERPEKCPIQTCEYHTKGFARKYDKNRHTLTHYKGTMVCGFCPGSGSAAEKSFNRADVFKRHLTAVHGVEQTPPNSRKKSSAGANANKKLTGYAPDATGKCSTCSQTFSNAQDFYEHLDDCVLRIVQQEDPAEAINAKRLAEVENDKDVHQTLEKNNLPTTTDTVMANHDDEDADSGDDDDDSSPRSNSSPATRKKGNPANGVQKSRGVTHSRGGVPLGTKTRSRKNRRDYPSSWGFDKGQMTMKKRVMAVFDGPRRLAKDDMMLSTDHEVRLKLSDGKSYVTDLDVQTLKRAAGFHGATDEEKGPWISDDPTAEQLKEMQQMLTANTTTTTTI